MLNRRWAAAIMAFQAIVIIVFAGLFVRAESQNSKQQNDIEESIETGRGLLSCLVSYADQMTNALEDRDTVNSTARAAAVDWLNAILDSARDPDMSDPQDIIELIRRYRDALERLDRPKQEFNLTVYPDIVKCLEKNDLPVPEELRPAQSQDTLFRLISYTAAPKMCWGKRITIRGTNNADVITGTGDRDVILAKGGGDLINASGGKDRICAGSGNDIVNGGTGLDRTRGGPGLDVCLSTIVVRSCP